MSKSKKTKSESTKPTDAVAASEKNRTKQRAEQLKRQKQRRRLTNISIGVVLFAIVAVAMIFFANQPAEAPIPDSISRYENLPQIRTPDSNFFTLGNIGAPVNVVEYSSFTCPSCEQFYTSAMDDIVELTRLGVISYTFVPRFVGSFQNPEGAARAAFCAGEQGLFFEMHDTLFSWHTTFGNTAFSQNRFISGAENLGLNVGDFRSCLSSGRANSYINAANRDAESRGFQGAPITTVNGVQISSSREELIRQVQIAQGNQPARPPIPADETLPPSALETDVVGDETPEAVEEATPETEAEVFGAPVPLGLAEKYEGISQAQSGLAFVLGDEDAPITLQEFGSYSCGLCANWYAESSETVAQLARDGVVKVEYYAAFTGRVSTEHLEDATKAAFCAGEQGQFFTYSGMLWSWHNQYGDDSYVAERLLAGAENLGLDTEAFSECLASDAAAEYITASMENVVSRDDVSGTPTIFVNGEALSENTAEALQAAVDAAGE